MASSELTQAALIVVLIAISLLALVTWTLYPRRKSSWDTELDSMVNGFYFELPEAVQEYKDLKQQHPEDKKLLSGALFKRAVSDIPIIRRMQAEGHGMPRLKVNDLLRDSSFINYKCAEDAFHREIEEVQMEADWIRPEDQWGQVIFQQAVDFIVQMQEQEMAARHRHEEEHCHREERDELTNDSDHLNSEGVERAELRQRHVS